MKLLMGASNSNIRLDGYKATRNTILAALLILPSIGIAEEPVGVASEVDKNGSSMEVADLSGVDDRESREHQRDEIEWRDFRIWGDEASGAFVKPVLQISSALVRYTPQADNTDLSGRTTTLLLSRFGAEGQLNSHISFRTVFERNMGFVSGRSGPIGTSVWEGNASLQTQETYVRLANAGFSLSGGIVPDPASIDYISANVLGLMGKDPYVRDPLLYSGMNQGQGLVAGYEFRVLMAGLSYTAGNPLVSSLSYGFGGDVSALGTLFTHPRRNIISGIPGSDIHMQVVTPSITLEHERAGLKLAHQQYFVDLDLARRDTRNLRGFNARGTTYLWPMKNRVRLFGSLAYRNNEQIDRNDLSELIQDFSALVYGGGLDLHAGKTGLGVMYYSVSRNASEDTNITDTFYNVGATYQVMPEFVIEARYSRSETEATAEGYRTVDTDSIILTMRMLL